MRSSMAWNAPDGRHFEVGVIGGGHGSKWDSIRARVLKRDKGLCQLCLRAGVVREAKTVDHIIPKAHGGTDADSNLQSLCWPCHKAKTARERLK